MYKNRFVLGLLGAVTLSVVANAVDYAEVEPNDSKATATPTGAMVAGDRLVGVSTSSTGAGIDNFLVQMAGAPLGIYRHRLLISTPGTAGHTGTIRGVNQTGTAFMGGTAGATDTAVQTSSSTSTPARFNQWYGFGKREQFYYRVTGGTSTTQQYFVTLETLAVTPTFVGSFQPGSITMTTRGQGHTSDTDIILLDANFNVIGQNDDVATSSAGHGFGSTLVQNLTPGTYYLAVSNFNFTSNVPHGTNEASPTESLLDFPNMLVNSSTSTNVNISFSISDGVTTIPTVANRAGVFDANFYQFQVVPEPGTYAAVATGVLGLLAMRRRRA